jgi:hypothetical protein
LVSAGNIKGFVTTNGVQALPGVPVVATDVGSTTVIGSAISGVDGLYYIYGVPTGTYIVSPQLESGETSSPGIMTQTVTVTPQVGWSTFTIANAFGEITGVVGTGSSTSPITTGVLVVASTNTITTANPPDVNSGIRSGPVIYYSASSDAEGRYTLPVRGNANYYLYGWYTSSVDVESSTTTKKTAVGNPQPVSPGSTVTRDISW